MTRPTPDSEALLEAAQAGDRSALVALLACLRPRLRRMAQLRLDPRIAARVGISDVLQDVDVQALDRIGDYPGPAKMPFFVWLRLLTHQRLLALARQHLGAAARDVRRELAPSPPRSELDARRLSEMILAAQTSPSAAAQRAEQRERLWQAMATMDPTDREVLSLRHFEQLSNAEAAGELGMEPSATSKRYLRALQKLRSMLER